MKTIEERLEAITQTVELVAQMHIENDRKFEERSKQFEERFKKTESQISRIVGITESLAQIAKSREQRIDRIEGQ